MSAVALPEPPSLPQRLYTVDDVCSVARTSPATTWRLISRGVLQTVKIGRRTLIKDESVQRLVEVGAP
jgi:excisionase family DNA binding protein